MQSVDHSENLQTEKYLWRGSLLPLGREAALALHLKSGPAAQSSGSKLPRHRGCIHRVGLGGGSYFLIPSMGQLIQRRQYQQRENGRG
ncbi:hypothetical protein EI534_03030 [Pseudomonas frederiksbergensis]|nr:hypothetical protein [Pseudomonas frederiksbergensis]